MYVIHLALNHRMFLSGVKQDGYCLIANVDEALKYANEEDAKYATTKIANTNAELWAIKKVNT